MSGEPTHVLWRDGSAEFVALDGHTSEYPDLVLIAEGWGDPFMVPNFETRTFSPDLAAARGAKWEEVKAKRHTLENGVAATPIGPVQCDDSSKIKICGLVQMARIAWDTECADAATEEPPREPDPGCFAEEFTLADNSIVVLDAQTAVTLGVAVGAHVSAVHAVSRGLRGLIDAAETLAELDAIDIEAAAWPSSGQ